MSRRALFASLVHVFRILSVSQTEEARKDSKQGVQGLWEDNGAVEESQKQEINTRLRSQSVGVGLCFSCPFPGGVWLSQYCEKVVYIFCHITCTTSV